MRLRIGNMEVDVSRESPVALRFNAVGQESLPLAAELAVLQAKSYRGGLTDREEEVWVDVLERLREAELE